MSHCMWKRAAEHMLPSSEIIKSTFSPHPHVAIALLVTAFTKQGEKQGLAIVRREWTDCSFCLILSIIVKGSTEIAGGTES